MRATPTGRVLRLAQPVAEFSPTRRPHRQHLAELKSRSDQTAARLAALLTPQAEREAASRALPAALEVHRQALQDADLDDGDAAALDASRAEVLRLRKIVSDTSDKSVEIAGLRAEQVQIGAAIDAAVADVVFGEVARLTAEYLAASKRALVAQAALDGIAEYARSMADPVAGGALVGACAGATRLAHDLSEDAKRKVTLKGVLTSVRLAWSRFPRALAVDHNAACEPLEAAVALLPKRSEEMGGEHGNAA